jgi:cytochrome c-type biogenesis protein CcsB
MLKKISGAVFSFRLTAVLLVGLAVSIAGATFIENDYGTSTARVEVYNALWFQAMLFLGIVHLTGIIFINRLFQKKKFSVFLFHLSFLFILCGAAVTHYFGYEGMMHIRKGESSDRMISSTSYFQVTASNKNASVFAEKEFGYSALRSNYQKLELILNEKKIRAECLKIIPYAPKAVAETSGYPDSVWLRISYDQLSDTVLYFAYQNTVNKPVLLHFGDVTIHAQIGSGIRTLPFSLFLNDFILEHYPGSNSPSWFESKITLIDSQKNVREDKRIFMNNVLDYNGYRFYQSSYDPDEKGTVLSVNHDFWGVLVTYAGYFLLALGIVFSLLNPDSRFRKLSSGLKQLRIQHSKGIFIPLLFFFFITGLQVVSAQVSVPDSVQIDKTHAAVFGQVLIQDPGGRIKPINSFSSELLRKISRKTNFLGQTSDQVLLGMLAYPFFWQQVPMIRVSHPEIKKILHITDNYVSFSGIFKPASPNPEYLLGRYVGEVYRKKPAARNQFDNEIIRVNERANLCYEIYTYGFLRIFPKPGDPKMTWYSPFDWKDGFFTRDSVFVANIITYYLQTVREASKSLKWELPGQLAGTIRNFQVKNGGNLIPTSSRMVFELWYNKADIFDRIGYLYGIAGFLLLVLQLVVIFLPKTNLRFYLFLLAGLIVLAFVLHLAGLAARWYISGHAPWSNGYESLIYIALATVLAGLIFVRKSVLTLAATALLAWLTLFVAHLSWMDPEITNLVPVLKSYWLLIHVAIITASYGFLALGALLGFINMAVMIARTKKNAGRVQQVVAELSMIIEMTLIVGLYMVTIGTFLGGIWANESWGRYWGWDPKETWALVTILVYAFIAHMRLIPGLKGTYLLNLMAVLGISSVIMTYFGVNYYLSGMHSYAKGDPLPIPAFVYYTLAVVMVVGIAAYIRQRRVST